MGNHSKKKGQAETPDVSAKLAIEKQELEVRNLRHQVSVWSRFHEYLKGYAGLGSVIAAFVTITAVWMSSSQWSRNFESSQRVRVEERFERTLRQLAEGTAQQRAAALASLEGFLQEDDRDLAGRAASVIARAIPMEESIFVRNCEVELLSKLDQNKVSKLSIDSALVALIRSSRGLVKEGKLREQAWTIATTQASYVSAEQRAVSVSEAIVILLRKGARTRDFSMTYLADANLSGLDLSESTFDGSILTRTDFSNCDLHSSSFSWAVLEQTQYHGANLHRANFSEPGNERAEVPRLWHWLEARIHAMRSAEVVLTQTPFGFIDPIDLWGPNFSDANLTDANFEGFIAFDVRDNSAGSMLRVQPARFHGAKLDGANFVGCNLIQVSSSESNLLSSERGAWIFPDKVYIRTGALTYIDTANHFHLDLVDSAPDVNFGSELLEKAKLGEELKNAYLKVNRNRIGPPTTKPIQED